MVMTTTHDQSLGSTGPNPPALSAEAIPPSGPDPAAVTLAGLSDVLAAYRTCELATVTKGGVPVTWPAVSWFDVAAGQLVLTTSIALPRKAANIRRDPRVALLFSDPTGSDRRDLPQILVQGTAICPEEVRSSPRGLETYWRELWRRQPGSASYGTTPLDRWLFDFYYMRLVITVTPTVVTTRPPLIRTAVQRSRRPLRRDTSAYGEAGRRLPEFADAVLATVSGGALPTLRRVRPALDPSTQSLVLDGADPAELADVTTANLLCHRHDEQLGRLRQFGLVGTLDTHQGRTLLRPIRVLAAAEATNPVALARTVRRLRRATRRYLDRQGIERPVIPWQEYHRLASGD